VKVFRRADLSIKSASVTANKNLIKSGAVVIKSGGYCVQHLKELFLGSDVCPKGAS